jgi:uncharacterized protein YmfQ (DUF2313 family)
MGMSAEAYRAQLQALLPPGAAWPRHPDAALTRLLAAWGEELARIDARSDRLISEAMPGDALEMLEDWERVAGLPDACGAEIATTTAERRANLIAKLTQQGGASIPWFYALAEPLGYEIEIEEYRPFVCGLSRCGEDRLLGDGKVRYLWSISVKGPRLTRFQAGVSCCGDPLLKITHAEDLECLFKRYAQAHTHIIFAYEGDVP